MRGDLLLLLPLALVACGKSKAKFENEGEVPLAITNAPACPPGTRYMATVTIRIESGSDHYELRFDDKMYAPPAWAGREATVKVGICGGRPCTSWLKTDTKKIGGDANGLKLELPSGLELVCEHGTVAKN
jgi:hypothetical protein